MKFGFLSALGLLFIGLKLAEVITWSWWWVTAPLWAPAVVVIGCLVGLGVLSYIGNRKGW